MSHLGGLAAGLFVSFMFLPNLADRRWKAARKLASRVSTTLHTRLSSFGGSPAPLPVEHVAGESCWRRNAWLYYLVWLVSACIMLFLFVGLPVYVYVFRMPNLTCTPLVQGGL
jgi:type VI protein secretion system component VasF